MFVPGGDVDASEASGEDAVLGVVDDTEIIHI